MSYAFRELFDHLRQEISRAPASTFEAARARLPGLLPYPSLDQAVASMVSPEGRTVEGREHLVQDLVQEFRRERNPFWSSVILVGFFPALYELRGRLFAPHLPSDELDQLVVTSFLQVLVQLTDREIARRVALRLVQRTRRAAYIAIAGERRRAQPLVPFHDFAVPSQLASAAEQAEQTREELFELSLLLRRAPELGFLESRLEGLIATVLRREALSDYVARLAPQGGRARRRIRERLKRQRTRLLRRLRLLIASSTELEAKLFSERLP